MMNEQRPDPQADDELTVKEAAAYLHLMITHVLRLCERGTLGQPITTPDGPDWRIRRSELEAYAAQLQQPPPPRAVVRPPLDRDDAH